MPFSKVILRVSILERENAGWRRKREVWLPDRTHVLQEEGTGRTMVNDAFVLGSESRTLHKARGRRAAAGGDPEPLLGSSLLRNTRKGCSSWGSASGFKASLGSELESPDFIFLSQPQCCPRNNRDS